MVPEKYRIIYNENILTDVKYLFDTLNKWIPTIKAEYFLLPCYLFFCVNQSIKLFGLVLLGGAYFYPRFVDKKKLRNPSSYGSCRISTPA